MAGMYDDPLGTSLWHGKLPDPFNDLASQFLPRTMPDALRWSQAIGVVDPTFHEALERVASYFITDIEIKSPTRGRGSAVSQEAKDKFDDFLRKTLLIKSVLREAASNFLHYGNEFTSIIPPLKRRLYCAHCPGMTYPVKTVYNGAEFAFRWDGGRMAFNARCPKCGKRSDFQHRDEIGGAESEVLVKHWNPHEIDIRHEYFSNKKSYIWKIPDTYRRQIREGKLDELENCPWEIIQAVKNNDNFRFAPGVIYHMAEPALAGFDSAGWGFPKALLNFRQAVHCQMLRRFNEAICQEFLIPFRILSPAARAGSDVATDPMLGSSMVNFRANMQAMVRRHRRDPADIQISPIPVEYQMLGGEGNSLAPFQLIDQATDTMLNGAGIPADLYKGTLSLQAAPVGLRLFEARWQALVDQLNQLLDAIVDRIANLFSWEPVDAKLVRVTHADDLNRQMAKLQLMMGGQVSQTTGLRSVGMDFRTEQDQLLEEQEYVAQKQEDLAQSQTGRQVFTQMQAQSGAQPLAGQGGASQQPGQGGPGGAPQGDPSQASPQEIYSQAQQIAAQLQGLPEEQRRSQLVQLKRQSPVLHGVVEQQLKDQRQQQSAPQGQPKVAKLRIPSTRELAVLAYRASA